MDTNDDDAFYVHIHNEKKIRFGSARKGIYIIDGDITQYDRMWKDLPNETLDEVLYDTVEQNKQNIQTDYINEPLELGSFRT
mmetsp:Transcript_1241/g.1656  ORF Transcript_1241/g.1656 Transcript_1241/m.1656 type:complete len:82 (-) Transcript_1241:2748-2993(-)